MARLSTALVVLAALCWGLSGGIGGVLMADGWDPLVVSFYRGAIGLVFVLAWLALRPGGSGLADRRLWRWSITETPGRDARGCRPAPGRDRASRSRGSPRPRRR